MNDATPAAQHERSNLTHDQFLGGRVRVTQPKSGFRAGVDSVLLAASVSSQSRVVLELGAGVGTAGICVLADLPGAQAMLLELQPELVALAKQNLAGNDFSSRAEVLEIDVTAPGAERFSAGVKADHFTSVIANPPFFDPDKGTLAPGGNRATSRHMPAQALDKWVKTAATSVASQGEVIFIYAVTALPQLLQSFTSRFGAVCVWPIAPRPGTHATRVLIRGIKGSRAPMRLQSPMVLHEGAGNHFAPEIDQMFRGQRRLGW